MMLWLQELLSSCSHGWLHLDCYGSCPLVTTPLSKVGDANSCIILPVQVQIDLVLPDQAGFQSGAYIGFLLKLHLSTQKLLI